MANVSSTITLDLKTTGFIAAIAAVKEVTDVLSDAQVEFDKINAALITVTGSTQKAAGAFKTIQDFAAKTPYDVNQTAEAFIKLVNMGLNPSEKAMMSYANTATAMGKSLEQMVEAVADAATGEFERLKEFGIRAKSHGDEVTFIFQGVSTTVKKNADEIQQYLQNLGETKFGDAIKNQADTYGVAVSNLGDKWEQTKLVLMGAGLEDVFKNFVKSATDNLDRFQDNVGEFGAGVKLLFETFISNSKKVAEMYGKILEAMGINTTATGKLLVDAFVDFPANLATILNLASAKFEERIEVWQLRWRALRSYFSNEIVDYNKEMEAIQSKWEKARDKAFEGRDKVVNYKPPEIPKLDLGQFNKGTVGGDGPDDAALKKAAATAKRLQEEITRITQSEHQKRLRMEDEAVSNAIEKSKIREANEVKIINDTIEQYRKEGKLTEQIKADMEAQITLRHRQGAVEREKITQEETKKQIDEAYRKEKLIGDLETNANKAWATLQGDKIKIIKATAKAEIDAVDEKYKQFRDKYGADTRAFMAAEQQKAAIAEKYRQEEIRVNGTYLEKLSQHFKDNFAQQGSVIDQFTTGMKDVSVKAFDDIAEGMAEMAVSGKASWADMGMAIIKQIEMLIAKMLVMYAVQQLVGMFSGGMGSATQYSATTGLGQWGPNFGKADGGAFDNGVEFFADGGVVDKPTMFQSSRGLGVMGEAGPEAIMPLARGSDGKLGVRSEGGGSSGIVIGSINVTLQAKEDETSDEQSAKIAKAVRSQLEQLIDKRIGDNRRPGGISNPTQIKGVW